MDRFRIYHNNATHGFEIIGFAPSFDDALKRVFFDSAKDLESAELNTNYWRKMPIPLHPTMYVEMIYFPEAEYPLYKIEAEK